MNRTPIYGNEDLLSESGRSLVAITLNRKHALNALSTDMIRNLMNTLSACESNAEIRGVLIESSSPKAFCAGGDIRFLHDARRTERYAKLRRFFTEEYRLNHLIHRYSKPYIALLDGVVMGGGMGIAQSSSAFRLRIVTERTRMAMPEVNIGLFPDVGGSYFLSRMPGETGTWMALTGETINATDALYAGLADVFIPGDELFALRNELLTAYDSDPLQLAGQFTAAFDKETYSLRSLFAEHRERIDHHFSKESVAAILASLDGDTHPFAAQTAAAIRRRSPLMLCVTLEQLRRGKTMTIEQCLRMERSMMHHCFEHPDALEGIRAAIIDKDNRPRWRPATLKDVSPDMVERFFMPAWSEHDHPLRDLA